MKHQDSIDSLKTQLSEAETAYCHAIASGDWQACAAAKIDRDHLRRQIGRLIKQKISTIN